MAPGTDVLLLSPSWGQPCGAGFAAAISGQPLWPPRRSHQRWGRQGPAAGSCCPFPFHPLGPVGMDVEGMRNPTLSVGSDGEAQDLLGSLPTPAPFSSPLNPAQGSVWWAAVKIALGLS